MVTNDDKVSTHQTHDALQLLTDDQHNVVSLIGSLHYHDNTNGYYDNGYYEIKFCHKILIIVCCNWYKKTL